MPHTYASEWSWAIGDMHAELQSVVAHSSPSKIAIFSFYRSFLRRTIRGTWHVRETYEMHERARARADLMAIHRYMFGIVYTPAATSPAPSNKLYDNYSRNIKFSLFSNVHAAWLMRMEQRATHVFRCASIYMSLGGTRRLLSHLISF